MDDKGKDQQTKALMAAARAFAKKKHGGLSARIRERLEELKQPIQLLVTERLSIADIQEFIQAQTGMRIGIAVLRQYCQDNFNYPPRKKDTGGDKS